MTVVVEVPTLPPVEVSVVRPEVEVSVAQINVAVTTTGPPGPAGATDHGALTGLLDNDHPQYVFGTVGTTPPADPLIDQIWVDTSS